MTIASGIKYTCTQLPESREWFRLVSGMVNTAQDYGIDTLFGATLGPIGKLAKGLDGAYYAKKSIEDIDVTILSVRNYDRTNHKESLISIFNATVKITGDVCATLKVLGTIGGVVMLAPHAKSFGYVKNVCSVYSASVGVFKGVAIIWAEYHTDPTANAARRKNISLATVAVIGSMCSIWLNGMGGLDSYIGAATFAEKGMQRLQPWTFNAAVLTSNITGIAKNIATAPAA
ncbi:MAG: hypothetical protein KFB93_02410 [Simkaniaceae bacterium]|nr:MAG: hypothetical protein KFB93_02410 [Simkaniaceae bacterium]